jgi:hypothetical protein
MKSGTAAVITRVTADMLKNLPTEAVHYIAELISRNWNKYECPEWHTTTVIILYQYKGKGKQCDLINWRGLCLKELTAKVICSVTAIRLCTVLATNNTEEQFATVGCQEALHFIRFTHVLRRLHQKETFVLFVDLI